MRLYIAGPMTGLPNFNYPAFHAAEKSLRARGYEVLNPARNPEQSDWLGYMRHAVKQVAESDGIALLPGWEQSRGARVEFQLATGMGLDALPLHTWVVEGRAA
jgi:hypothetical protein